MSFSITIAGVAKSIQAGSLNIQLSANDRATASFRVVSENGTYRPALDAEVIIQENGTTIFGGLVGRPRETGPFAGARTAIDTAISAVDFNVYPEWRYVNETIAAGTMKAGLIVLTTYLATYGVTLHASQVDGPSFPELKYRYRRLDEVLNEFATLTADFGEPYVWRIDGSKVLRMYQPSTTAAPFNISSNTPPDVVSDIEVEVSREHYANKIILLVPTQTENNRTETFTGDGVTSAFTLQYTLTSHTGFVYVNGEPETLSIIDIGFNLAAFWLYDPADNTINRVPGAGPPTAGATISVTFTGTFEGEATASDAGEIATNKLREKVVTVESVPSTTTAQAIADGELAKRVYQIKKVKYSTLTSGILPGQSQSVTVSRRNLSAMCVVSDVTINDYLRDQLRRTVTLIADGAQTNIGRGFKDELKLWRGDKTGGSATARAVVSNPPVINSGGAAAPPHRAVQVNRNGTFGADGDFRYYEDEKSLVVGVGSVISAAAFSHCYILGENLEIADA